MRSSLRLVASALVAATSMWAHAARADEPAPPPPNDATPPIAEPTAEPPAPEPPTNAEPPPVEPLGEGATMRLPVRMAERPVSAPAAVLNAYAVLSYVHEPNHDEFANVDLGASAGITDDFTISARVAPLEIASPEGKLRYGERSWFYGPSFGALLRFVRGPVEIAGSLAGTVFTVKTYKGGLIAPSVPVHFHATERMRLDVLPYAQIWFADQELSAQTVSGLFVTQTRNANHTRVGLDVDAVYNLTDAFYVSVGTGVTIYDVTNAGKHTVFPVGATAGLTVLQNERGPLLDLVPFVDLPSLLFPSRSPALSADWWRIGLEAVGHFYL